MFFTYISKNFNNYKLYLNFVKFNSISNKKPNLLGSYLAGLIEGDGYILLRKEQKKIPAIIITFHEKEIPMFEKLKFLLKSVNIYKEKKTGGKSIYRFQITNTETVINVINLINGYFRTPKIEALHRAIDRLNKLQKTNLLKLPLDFSDFGSNAWLAGFIDADGHFSIKLSGSYVDSSLNTRGRVQCVFSINQREIYKRNGESFKVFMTKLADFFQSNLNFKLAYHPSFKKPAKLLVFYVQSDKKHFLVTNYFKKYPLMSSKHLNYLCYSKALAFLGKRLTEQEILEIRAIKNSMNNKRTYFNWNHLNKFYTS